MILIISSILQLKLGKVANINFHLIDRALVVFIPIIPFFFIKGLKYYTKLAIHYTVSVLITTMLVTKGRIKVVLAGENLEF